MVINVQEGVITIVCGPALSGKTFICRKIQKQVNGEYISYKEIWKQLSRNLSKQEKLLMQTKEVLDRIKRASNNNIHVIIETPFLRNQQMLGLITALEILYGCSKINLIKIYPKDDLHLYYWQKKKGNKPPKYVLQTERKKFQEVIKTNYSTLVHQEYLVTNPEEVEFE